MLKASLGSRKSIEHKFLSGFTSSKGVQQQTRQIKLWTEIRNLSKTEQTLSMRLVIHSAIHKF
jgi:hypothetical protein